MSSPSKSSGRRRPRSTLSPFYERAIPLLILGLSILLILLILLVAGLALGIIPSVTPAG